MAGRYTTPSRNARFFTSQAPVKNRKFFYGGSQSWASNNQPYRGGSSYSAGRNPYEFSLSKRQQEQRQQLSQKEMLNMYAAQQKAQSKPLAKFEQGGVSISGRIAQSVAQNKQYAPFNVQSSASSSVNPATGTYTANVDPYLYRATSFSQSQLARDLTKLSGNLVDFTAPAKVPNPAYTGDMTTLGGTLPGGSAIKALSAAAKIPRQALLSEFEKAGGKISTVGATSTKNLVPVNGNTARIVTAGVLDWLKRVGAQVVKPANAVKIAIGAIAASLGTAGAGMYLYHDAKGNLEAARYAALDNGNTEAGRALTNEIRELVDLGFADWLKWFIPGYGVGYSLAADIRSTKITTDVYDEIFNDIDAQNAGATSDEIWDARRLQQFQQEQALLDQQLKNSELIIRMKEEAASRGLAEQERYWANQLRERSKFEEEQRKANLEYWQEYWKLAFANRENSSPSNLKFGLL